MGLHQNKKLLHSKRKRPPVEGERVFANSISNKGLIFKIHKELLQLNINKANHQIFLKCIEDTLRSVFMKTLHFIKTHKRPTDT